MPHAAVGLAVTRTVSSPALRSTAMHGASLGMAFLAPALRHGLHPGMRLCAGSDIGQQIRELRGGVDVAVGTPGRVIDLLERGLLALDQASPLGWTSPAPQLVHLFCWPLGC